MSLIAFILVCVIPVGLLIGIPIAGPIGKLFDQHAKDKRAGL